MSWLPVALFRIAPAAAGLVLTLATVSAQSIGPNIDVVQEPVADCTLPTCDKFNKMLETDIAASPLNPGRAVAVFNDYRYSLVSKQSWCSYAYTKDGGYIWKNTAVPDLPGTPRLNEGNFCTDPAVVWDVFGSAHIVFLAGTKGNDTQVFVMNLAEKNDASGDLANSGVVQVDLGQNFTGTGLDKPSITYTAPTSTSPTDKGIIHLTYAIFDGFADRTKVMYARSTDGGVNFSRPVKLNGTLRQNNNTTAIVGADGTVYVFWTSFDPTQRGIVFVKSTDGGQSFTVPSYVAGGPTFFPYHQIFDSTVYTTFFSDRSLVIPAAAAAGPAGGSADRLLVAWQEYVDTATGLPASPTDTSGNVRPGVSPRIVVTASFDQGQTWVAQQRRAAEVGPPDAMQIRPRLAVSGGMASLLFDDARGGGCAYSTPSGTTFDLPLMNGLTCKRNIRVMQADLSTWTSGLPGWLTSQVVTQFPMKGGVIVNRQPNCVGGSCPAVFEPNHPSSSSGTIAFTGDYNGLASATPLVKDSSTGNWRLPLQTSDPRTFYAAWADNRWEKLPLNSSGQPEENASLWKTYDPNSCTNPGTRNTKPFFAKISPGLAMHWTGTDKQLQLQDGTIVVQAVLTVQNLTSTERQVRVTIQTPGWSFISTISTPTKFRTAIGRYSSISKVMTRTGSSPSVQVVAQEIDTNGQPIIQGLTASLTFNVSQAQPVSVNGALNNLAISSLPVKSLGRGSNQKTQPSFGFDTFGFDTFGFDTFGFDTFGFDTFGFDTQAPPDRDVTWTVTGTGSTATASNALTTIGNGQELLDAGYGFQLLLYKTYTIPDFIPASCTLKGTPIDQPISNVRIYKQSTAKQITNFGFDTFGFDTFGFDTFGFDTSSPSELSNASFAVASTDQVNVTLRAYRPSGTTIAVFDPDDSSKGVNQAGVSQTLNPDGTRSAAFASNTVPIIVPTVSPQANGAGWNNGLVAISWSVKDKGALITSATLTSDPPITIRASSALTCPTVSLSDETPVTGIKLTCSATNGGLKSNSVSVTVKIDKTAPDVGFAVPTPAPNAAGWNNTDVSVAFTATDKLSGVASQTSSPLLLTTEGAAVTGSVTVADVAGNSTSYTSPPVKIDTTPPAIAAHATTADGQNYMSRVWTNQSVTVTFTCADNLSGVATVTPSSTTVSREGENQSVRGTCTDRAGNSASVTFSGINIDTTAPTVSVPASGASYLLNANVTSSCSDALSGVAACTPQNLPTGTVGQKTFTAADVAGNTTTVTYYVTYKFILTPPKSPAALGSAVPLIWQLTDAKGQVISDMSSLVKLFSEFTLGVQPINGVCPVTYPGANEVTLYSPATGATGNSSFRFISSTKSFQFNWDTSKALATGPGCYTIVWQLKDNAGPDASPNPGAILSPSLLRMATVQLK